MQRKIKDKLQDNERNKEKEKEKEIDKEEQGTGIQVVENLEYKRREEKRAKEEELRVH